MVDNYFTGRKRNVEHWYVETSCKFSFKNCDLSGRFRILPYSDED